MVINLRTHYAKQVAETNETDLRHIIEDGIEKAERYGVVTVTDVERFLGYMITLGQDFDKTPETSWAGDILRQENISGISKMDSIDDRMNFRPMEKI